MIKGILFDLDGTIINTNELIFTSFNYVLNEYMGLNVSREQIVKGFGEPLTETFLRYDKERAEELVNIYLEYSHARQDELIKSYPGVEEALSKLKELGIKLAIVTSKRRAVAYSGMDTFGLRKYFDVIVTPEDTIKHKPHGEPVLKACELLGLKPCETIMVGDSHNDILSGKNVGAKTSAVSYTEFKMEDILKYEPDYVIDHISELIKLI